MCARCEIYRVFVRLPWRSRPSEPLARKKAVQRRIFTGAGLPYAYCDGNSTVRATNADRSPQLSCLLSASIVRLLSIVRSGKVGRVLDPSEPFLSFIVVVRAGPRPARLQKTLASQCCHGRVSAAEPQSAGEAKASTFRVDPHDSRPPDPSPLTSWTTASAAARATSSSRRGAASVRGGQFGHPAPRGRVWRPCLQTGPSALLRRAEAGSRGGHSASSDCN